jgi:murein DD-endopeptidase MepM/ murein hydrolase activator NlpD
VFSSLGRTKRRSRLTRTIAVAVGCLSFAVAAPASVTVKRGDTLWDIAKAHAVSVATIKKLNNLTSDRINAGQTLRLTAPSAAGVPTPSVAKTASGASSNSPIWPLSGRITDTYGMHDYIRVSGSRMHTGVDIAAPTGTAVHAATSGKVKVAGWDRSGYGNLVVIAAYDGREYYYGHNSALLVRAGQTVAQGQVIARVGSTGASTGPHLHFEIRVRGVALDPVRSLPGSQVKYATYRPPAGSSNVGGGK